MDTEAKDNFFLPAVSLRRPWRKRGAPALYASRLLPYRVLQEHVHDTCADTHGPGDGGRGRAARGD